MLGRGFEKGSGSIEYRGSPRTTGKRGTYSGQPRATCQSWYPEAADGRRHGGRPSRRL